MDDKKVFRLSDEAIAQIATLLQLGIITGTDIVDHLRMMVLQADDKETLFPSPEYQEIFDKNVQKLTDAAIQMAEQKTVEHLTQKSIES